MTPKQKLAARIGGAAAAAAAVFVATHEGAVLRTYRDPIGIVTSCTGHTGPELQMGQTFTKQQCDEVLYADLLKHAADLDCVKVALTDGQKVALLSFDFNVGRAKFCGSSLVRKANAGEPPAVWCAELSRWVLAGGKELPGLVRRRAEERRLCES